jgi:putative transposase
MTEAASETAYKTYSYRVKDASAGKRLTALGNAVNYVWNYCNSVQTQAVRKFQAGLPGQKWPTKTDLQVATKGSSKMLGLSSQTVQMVCHEYINKRNASKKQRLSWRSSFGSRRSLGWIPFTNQDISNPRRGVVELRGHKFHIWQHRELSGTIKSGNFSQDARGRWYCNLVCAVVRAAAPVSGRIVGIDLGFKTVAKAFNAPDLEQSSFYRDLEPKLAEAQRRGRKRQVKTIHAKIANRRKNALHQYSRSIVEGSAAVFVGNISSAWQIQSGNAKATLDVSWSMLRNFLRYKCDHARVAFADVDERFSTQDCSVCASRSGPKGRNDLGIRQWVCSNCETVHDRDGNAAINIARFGCETLGLKWPGSPVL